MANFGHSGTKGVIFSAPREGDPNNSPPLIQSIGTRDAQQKAKPEKVQRVQRIVPAKK